MSIGNLTIVGFSEATTTMLLDILDSKCSYCDDKGIFTLRTTSNKKKILIGDDKIYKPVCRKHYIQYNN